MKSILQQEYDDFVTSCGHSVESFMPCQDAMIRQEWRLLFQYNDRPIWHPILNICKYKRCSYFTCITFRESETVVSRHVCDTLPVFVGSVLDKKICEYMGFSSNFDPKLLSDLAGMIYVDNSLANFPFVLTNRKELAHRTLTKNSSANFGFKSNFSTETDLGEFYGSGSRNKTTKSNKSKRDIFCLFVYDKSKRGFKFALNENNRLLYRDKYGKEYESVEESGVFPEFSVSKKHIDYSHIANGFKVLFQNIIHIDSLKNKRILSPVNILDMMLNLAKNRPELAQRVMQRGQLEYFASTKITFAQTAQQTKKCDKVVCSLPFSSLPYGSPDALSKSASKRSHTAWKHKNDAFDVNDKSFCYRKLQPNQIGLQSGFSDIYERVVVRPIPGNVQKSNVPIETEYFLCMADKTYAVDSPFKWMLLLPGVVVSSAQRIQNYASVDNILEHFLENGMIYTRSPDFFESPPSDEIPVFVLGGLLTPYVLKTVHFEAFFFKTKSLNPFTEVYKTDVAIVVGQEMGIPFIKLKNVYVSPLELNTCFVDLKSTMTNALFGSTAMENCLEMTPYASLGRLIVSVVFYKNRFCCFEKIQYFPLTTENTCAYIIETKTGGSTKFCADTCTMNLKIFFSSHPQVSAEEYGFNKLVFLPTCIINRGRLDFDCQPNVHIEMCEDVSTINEYTCGVVTRKYISVAKISKLESPFKARIFPQTKFFLLSLNDKNDACKSLVYQYLLIKYFDEEYFLINQNPLEFSYSFVETKCNGKPKIFVDFVTSVCTKSYDGTKFCDENSQKGIVQRKDLSRYGKYAPDMVASAFSVLSRSPLNQLKKMMPNNRFKWDTSTEEDRKFIEKVLGTSKKKSEDNLKRDVPLYAPHEFAVLRNVASNMKSLAPLKFDMLFAHIMKTNNCNRAAYSIQQEALAYLERNVFLPFLKSEAFDILNFLRAEFVFTDENNNQRSSLNLFSRQ